jgi:tRNA pseudouridine55 synthase
VTAAGSGVLIADKPAGLTSFQCVASVKRLVRPLRIGHGGTLDPAATGVLPLLIGQATRLMPYLVEHDKEYVATVRLGVTTDTLDLTGRIRTTRPVPVFTGADIEAASRRFVGWIRQAPPMFSAAHHQGRRLHELARQGLEVERPSREVLVRSITVESVDLPRITLRVVCGKGAYVRVLAADIGEALGTGGAIERLIRTRVGPLSIDDAVPWARLEQVDAAGLAAHLLPPAAALEGFPEATLSAPDARGVLHGRTVPTVLDEPGRVVRLYGPARTFLGVGRVLPGRRLKPERLLRADLPGPAVVRA